jgi:outer membrane protein
MRSPHPRPLPRPAAPPQPAGLTALSPTDSARPWRAWRRGLAAAAAGVLLAGPLAAQDLQTLYQAARVYDATYLAALAQAQAADFRTAQVEALARPTLAATASSGLSRFDPPGLGARNTTNVQAALNGRYPLYNRANDVSITQARRSLVSTQADLDAAEQDLIVRVAQAYFEVLAAQDALATARANKTAISEQLASARRNFEVGTATITDTREAQAFFDLATAQELAADNELQSRRIALDQLVGRTGVEPQPLRLPAELPALLPADPEMWVAAGEEVHPTIRRARVGMEVAELETERARAAEGPTVDAVASVGPTYARGNGAQFSGTSTSASVGVQLNWPLFTGGLTQNRIRETLALSERARNDLDAARRGVAQATRVAWFGVQSGQAQVRALEAAESSSQLLLEATELGYRVGVRVNLDVLNAQTQLFRTRRDLARARYDVLLGGLRLRQASGQLTAADLETINALLQP